MLGNRLQLPAVASWLCSLVSRARFTVLVGAAIGILTWPGLPAIPAVGLDSSWQAALHLAADQGLAHGTEIAFTYGPLGFLQEPVAISGSTAAVSGLFAFFSRVAFGIALLWATLRVFPLVAAVPLAVMVGMVTPTSIAPVILALALCAVALQPDAPPWARRELFYLGGVYTAFQLLIKLSIGPIVLLIFLITALSVERSQAWRNVARVAIGLVPMGIALWFLSGQGLGNVSDFIQSSREIVSGYSVALALEAPVVTWDRKVGAALIIAVLVASLVATWHQAVRLRVGTVLVVGAVIFLGAKQGYVRHDGSHVDIFLATAAAPLVLLRWTNSWGKLAAAAIVVVIVAVAPGMTGRDLAQRVNPVPAFDQIKVLVDPRSRGETIEAARISMREAYGVDPRTLRLIGDHTVHASPSETNLVWAYDLAWEPLPIFQDYSAYTDHLDRQNAEALASDEGPERILRHLGPTGAQSGLDGRFPTFDAPASARAMLCHFRPARTTRRYQLLARGSNRCGGPRHLRTVQVDYGERVTVPSAPDRRSAVFARVDIEPSFLERLRTIVYRAPQRRITLDERWYRLVTEVAGNGLLLSLPRRIDYPDPFQLAANPASIVFANDGGIAASQNPLQISFFATRIGRHRNQ